MLDRESPTACMRQSASDSFLLGGREGTTFCLYNANS